MIKILCLSIWYPLSMSRYFEKALRHHPEIELKTTGPYTGSWIPWTNPQNPSGMNLPEKYAISPDIPLPFPPNVESVSYDILSPYLKDWKPDIILAIDAGINWTSKPTGGLVATIGTDPHVLNWKYDHARKISDKFFNMQLAYSQPGDIYLPYAYSKYDCFPDEKVEKDLDAVLVGNIYAERLQWVSELRKRGVKVAHELGVIFDEARALYNRGTIGLNWSTLNDLNCRFFELPAFKLAPVMNVVSDAHLFLNDGTDYLGFRNLNEALEAVYFLKDHNQDREDMAERAYKKIQPHTYDARVEQLLTECGFNA